MSSSIGREIIHVFSDETEAPVHSRDGIAASCHSYTFAPLRTELFIGDSCGTPTVPYDLVGEIARGTTLTRRTSAAILRGISPAKLLMFKNNPEEFIRKVIKLIKEQKATMIVEHIKYNITDGQYDSDIFTANKRTDFDKAYPASKHITDYVFTDGMSENSIEMKFAKALEAADEVCVYAKLPRTFQIPTPVGNYAPDWAIAFNKGAVKHIFFIAEFINNIRL